jgi:hypothetical protein
MPRPDPTPRRNPKQGWLKIALRWGDKPLRKPPEAGVPQPAEPPRGPLPLTGGAEAPLE